MKSNQPLAQHNPRNFPWFTRRGLWALACLAPLLMTGCSLPTTELTVDRVGPARVSGSVRRGLGQLQVYSERERMVSGGMDFYPHTGYWIYNLEGKKVRSIPNRAGITDHHATLVRLPAGEYRVVARAEGYGLITIPALVASENVTEVFLERGGMPSVPGVTNASLVRLPDGRAVGWRVPADVPRP